MATIADLETRIVNRLKAKITDVAVEGFPEKPSQYTLTHPKGALLVHYHGSAYGPNKATDIVHQDRRPQFEVTIVMRQLRAHGGAYGYLDLVRAALAGFKPIDGAKKMRVVRDQFISETDGIWQYAIRFETELPSIEADEDEMSVLTTRISSESVYGNVTVETPQEPEGEQ